MDKALAEDREQGDPAVVNGFCGVKLLEEGNSACKLDPFMPMYPIPRDIPLKEIKNAEKIFQVIRDAVGDYAKATGK